MAPCSGAVCTASCTAVCGRRGKRVSGGARGGPWGVGSGEGEMSRGEGATGRDTNVIMLSFLYYMLRKKHGNKYG
jgi:hypothetical protein